MKNRQGLMDLYRSYTGSTIARPINQYNTIPFESRIVQDYSYVPDYLIGEM